MINKQRVQRIRGIIYTCIVLAVFVPVILMIVLSFRLIGILGDLRSALAETPPSQSSVEDFREEEPPAVISDDETIVPQSAGNFAQGEPQANPLDADEQTSETDAPSHADNGRYAQNLYLPASYPNLYFDTLPIPQPAKESSTLYLTFDNTPASQAGDILSVLEQHAVHATFFVWWNERMGSDNHAFYKQLADAGHRVGIHSASNAQTFADLYSDVDRFLQEFDRIFAVISEATGEPPRLYRLPGGSIHPSDPNRQAVLSGIKAELDARGFLQYDWNASAQDAVSPSLSKEQVLQNLERSMAAGGGQIVVLLHDGTGSSSTAEALDEFIGQYKAAGYTFDVLGYDTKPVSFLDQ